MALPAPPMFDDQLFGLFQGGDSLAELPGGQVRVRKSVAPGHPTSCSAQKVEDAQSVELVAIVCDFLAQVSLRALLASFDEVDRLVEVSESDDKVGGVHGGVEEHGGFQHQHAGSGSHAGELRRTVPPQVLAGCSIPCIERRPDRRQVRAADQRGDASQVVSQTGLRALVARPRMPYIGTRLLAWTEQESSEETPAEQAGFVALCKPLGRTRAKDGDARLAKCDRLFPQDSCVDVGYVEDLGKPGDGAFVVRSLQRTEKGAELLEIEDRRRLSAEHRVQRFLAERVGQHTRSEAGHAHQRLAHVEWNALPEAASRDQHDPDIRVNRSCPSVAPDSIAKSNRECRQTGLNVELGGTVGALLEVSNEPGEETTGHVLSGREPRAL